MSASRVSSCEGRPPGSSFFCVPAWQEGWGRGPGPLSCGLLQHPGGSTLTPQSPPKGPSSHPQHLGG